jgi:hypothetical protein
MAHRLKLAVPSSTAYPFGISTIRHGRGKRLVTVLVFAGRALLAFSGSRPAFRKQDGEPIELHVALAVRFSQIFHVENDESLRIVDGYDRALLLGAADMLPHLEMHSGQKSVELCPAIYLEAVLASDLETVSLESKSVDERQAVFKRRVGHLFEEIKRRELTDQSSDGGEPVRHSGLRLAVSGIHDRTQQMREIGHA